MGAAAADISTNAAELRALADRFISAAERGDVATLRTILAPDAVVWHNHDDIEQSVDQNLARITETVSLVSKRSLHDRRLNVFAGGFVLQFVMDGELANGRKLTMRNCLVCAVKDGRVQRVDEYLDSAALAVFAD